MTTLFTLLTGTTTSIYLSPELSQAQSLLSQVPPNLLQAYWTFGCTDVTANMIYVTANVMLT